MTVEFEPKNISDIKLGDKVFLRWDGYKGLPLYLSNTWADVVEVKRTRVVVQPASIVGTQTVKFQQIARIRKNE